mmetsp:Transcript_33705/g.68523  ORF Transcript_33705/g.68523 Transcript_33705/m.68523 type:complete len:93 (-) Transcript_33705:117-395(-)
MFSLFSRCHQRYASSNGLFAHTTLKIKTTTTEFLLGDEEKSSDQQTTYYRQQENKSEAQTAKGFFFRCSYYPALKSETLVRFSSSLPSDLST